MLAECHPPPRFETRVRARATSPDFLPPPSIRAPFFSLPLDFFCEFPSRTFLFAVLASRHWLPRPPRDKFYFRLNLRPSGIYGFISRLRTHGRDERRARGTGAKGEEQRTGEDGSVAEGGEILLSSESEETRKRNKREGVYSEDEQEEEKKEYLYRENIYIHTYIYIERERERRTRQGGGESSPKLLYLERSPLWTTTFIFPPKLCRAPLCLPTRPGIFLPPTFSFVVPCREPSGRRPQQKRRPRDKILFPRPEFNPNLQVDRIVRDISRSGEQRYVRYTREIK